MTQVLLFLLILNLLNVLKTFFLSIVGKTPEDNDSLTDAKVVIPLKYLGNFWKSLNIPLINCEVKLILTWSKNCVLADMATRDAESDNPAIAALSGATFKIKETK